MLQENRRTSKSIAINCILAQTIQTALAESFTIQPGHVLTLDGDRR